jgi:hypothetical protein
VQEVMRAIRSGERSAPKTVLGFLVIMTSILGSASTFAFWFFSGETALHYMVPIVFVVFIILFVTIVGAVLLICWKDPSKLMLGQITGREFALIQQLTLGDSNAGERIADVIVEIAKASDVISEQPMLRRASAGEGQ